MTALTAVLLFGTWTLLLALFYALPRVPRVLMGSQKADAWTRGNAPVDPGILIRAQHAHYNCLETFPVFAAVVIVGAMMDQAEALAGMAALVVYLRVGQSVVHLIGTSFFLVLIRATLFIAQLALILAMVWKLLG
ncbi:MAG: MAPEG family protein [Algiphilus sp.]